MQLIFDTALIEANRKRALATGDAGAGFLLDIAARELADRLNAVERHSRKPSNCMA